MSFKALFIANGFMLLFVMLCLIQSFNGINSSQLMNRLQEQGVVKSGS